MKNTTAAATTTKTRTGKRTLTARNVRAIRANATGKTYKQFAEKYGVTTTCIYNVVHYNTWAHID
jgi:hypothetical protein